jgi:hypothetical protein
LFDLFYKDNIKIIPRNLEKYLTPLALATLLLSSVGDGEKAILGKKGILDRYLVSVKDLKYLSLFLKNKYNIETEIKKSSRFNGGSLYIKNISALSRVVKPHLLHSQSHLLNMPTLKLTLSGTPLHISSFSYKSNRGFSTLPSISNSRDSKRKYRKEYELN